MDITLNIILDIPPLPTGKLIFPELRQAIATVAHTAHAQWLEYAQGKPLPTGKTITARSGAYLKSIQIRPLDKFHYEIWSDAPYASAIEYGTAQYDMKQMLNTSAKVRRSKNGKRYLIIPFRWGTGTGTGGGVSFGRNVMSKAQYEYAKQLIGSRVTSIGQRESGNYPGRMVASRKYNWGGRLNTDFNPTAFAQGMGRHMQGMVKFQNKDAKGNKHTSYLTFRVMSENSRGWVRPAQPGRFPLRTAVESVERNAQRIFVAALQRDVNNLLQ